MDTYVTKNSIVLALLHQHGIPFELWYDAALDRVFGETPRTPKVTELVSAYQNNGVFPIKNFSRSLRHIRVEMKRVKAESCTTPTAVKYEADDEAPKIGE